LAGWTACVAGLAGWLAVVGWLAMVDHGWLWLAVAGWLSWSVGWQWVLQFFFCYLVKFD
jgi:hypothetical protein